MPVHLQPQAFPPRGPGALTAPRGEDRGSAGPSGRFPCPARFPGPKQYVFSASSPSSKDGNLPRHPVHPPERLGLCSAAPRSWTRWSRAWPARCSEAPPRAAPPSSSSMRGRSVGAPASLLPACSAVPSQDPPEPGHPVKKGSACVCLPLQRLSVSHVNKSFFYSERSLSLLVKVWSTSCS